MSQIFLLLIFLKEIKCHNVGEQSDVHRPIVWAKKHVVSCRNLLFEIIFNIYSCHETVAHFVNDKRLSHVPGPNAHNFAIKDKTQAPYWSVSKDERFANRKVK